MDRSGRYTLLGCALLAALALGGCGGGGGDSGGPATTTIEIGVIQDAHTDGVSLTNGVARNVIGDDAGGNDFRGLLRFPLSSVPAGANVVGAFLNISFLDRHGTPAGSGPDNLGQMQFVRISGTAPLASGDYGAPALATDPANNLLIDLPNTRPRIGLLQLVQSALAAGDTHLKVRMQYTSTTNTNGVTDQMEFAALEHIDPNHAILEVITQP